MPNKEEKSGLAVFLLIRLAIGLVISLVILLVGAMLIASGTMPESAIAVIPVAAGFVGSLGFGHAAARAFGSKAFMAGLVAGLVFFLALFLLGAIVFWRWSPGASTVSMLLASLLGGLIGGMLSASRKKIRREKSHTYDTVRRRKS